MIINNSRLDQIFNALADSTRRGMLERLSKGETNITSLATPFAMSQPAISKHVRILEEAGLIQRTKRGRESIIRANPATAKQVLDWISHYITFWEEQFDDVEAFLKQTGQLNEQ